MKNQISKYGLIFLMIIFSIMLVILIYINFFKNNKNESYALLKDKGENEIIYLDSTIIELLNKLNNISYTRYDITIEQINENQKQATSDTNSGASSQGTDAKEEGNNGTSSNSGSVSKSTNQSENKTSKLAKTDSLLNSNHDTINWTEIAYGVETLYTAWPTISIDMKSLNVPQQDISNFSVTLDGVAKSVKSNDKNNTLVNLYNLYTMLPKFFSYFSTDESKLNIYYAKENILNAYIYADKDKWEEMNNSVNKAINNLSNIMNDNMIYNTKKVNIDKAYTLLQELQRGIAIEEKEIFYLKYKLAIEQLEIL